MCLLELLSSLSYSSVSLRPLLRETSVFTQVSHCFSLCVRTFTSQCIWLFENVFLNCFFFFNVCLSSPNWWSTFCGHLVKFSLCLYPLKCPVKFCVIVKCLVNNQQLTPCSLIAAVYSVTSSFLCPDFGKNLWKNQKPENDNDFPEVLIPLSLF